MKRLPGVLAAILVVLLSWVLYFKVVRRTVIHEMRPGSPALRYTTELSRIRVEPPVWRAPDSSAWIENMAAPFTLLLEGCHDIWLVTVEGKRRRIITYRESEPGSGDSINAGWSQDSKAILLKGSHSGLDCRGRSSGHLEAIYTREDDTLWRVVFK